MAEEEKKTNTETPPKEAEKVTETKTDVRENRDRGGR